MASLRLHTDPELIALLRQGETEAFDEIYRRYWKRLFNEGFKRTGDRSCTEEIVQDVFIDLWTNRTSRQIDHLLPYLLSAIRYQVFYVYRKKQSLPVFEEPLEHLEISSEKSDSSYFAEELTLAIQRWLSTQPEKRREIFRLRYLDQLTTREIAEELNLSQKTVQNQLLNGQKSLRETVSKLFLLMIIFADHLR